MIEVETTRFRSRKQRPLISQTGTINYYLTTDEIAVSLTPGRVGGGPLMTLVYLSKDPSRIIYFALAAMLRGWTHDG